MLTLERREPARKRDSPGGLAELCAWVGRQAGAPDRIAGVCVEATGRLSWTFVETLDGRLGPVSIVNPAHPVQVARSVGLHEKSNRTDACVLALFSVAPCPQTLAR